MADLRTRELIQAPNSRDSSSTEPQLAELTATNYPDIVIADIACDADYDYFVSCGSDIDATVERIESIINTMNIQYDRDVGISHRIATIIVRSDPNDPYTKTYSHDAVKAFYNYWKYNHADIDRNVAHLFSGKDFDGPSIMVSFMNSICMDYAYGLS